MNYDLNNWSKLTEHQRENVCLYQKLSLSFIQKHWNNLTGYQRNRVCCCQKLSLSFIQKHWNELTEYQRDRVCSHQKLSLFFIQKHWSNLTGYQRDCVYSNQKLSLSFIQKHWNKLTKYQRDCVNQVQKQYPNKKERVRRARAYAKKHGLTIKGNWLYAMREHDQRGCGIWNKTVFYVKGKLNKDWHVDPRAEEEASFGYGVWSKKGNIKVRVPLDAFVVAVNRDDGKARVEAFEVT